MASEIGVFLSNIKKAHTDGSANFTISTVNGETHTGNIVEVGKTGVILTATFVGKRTPEPSESPRVFTEARAGKIFILFDKIVSVSSPLSSRELEMAGLPSS
jgi:hypothetical protein